MMMEITGVKPIATTPTTKISLFIFRRLQLPGKQFGEFVSVSPTMGGGISFSLQIAQLQF
jgi:hypothetical protein